MKAIYDNWLNWQAIVQRDPFSPTCHIDFDCGMVRVRDDMPRQVVDKLARLIESAPKLAVALRNLLDCVEGMDQFTLDADFQDAADTACVLLAKLEKGVR